MIVRSRPRIVVLGRVATMPYAGVVWQTLHYLLGFERMGFDAYYVEAHAVTPRHFMRHLGDDGAPAAAEFLAAQLGRFGLGSRWAYQALHSDGHCYGLAAGELAALYESAELVINLHGGTWPRAEHRAARRLICVATDPVQMEVELNQRSKATIGFFRAHSHVFSFGENFGRSDCELPVVEGFPIRPTRQPVVLELWRGARDAPDDAAEPAPFTTVANWTQQRDLRFAGELYTWSKDLEFLKLIDLPRRARRPLELALSRCPEADRQRLVAHGWRVRDALAISAGLDDYRAYVSGSHGEFTVAKEQNVRLRSGWFSDRSATYLAAGRPVVTQDTGFGNVLPTGAGLFAFSNADEAAAALETIDADYPRHRRAAHEIAREHFAHDVVLGALLDACGVERPPAGRRARRREPPRVTLVAHRFPPDAVGGVERYTENLAASLTAAGGFVSVVARRPGPGAPRREVELLPSGVPVHRLAGGRVRRERFLAGRAALEEQLLDALAESDPDVVHVNHVLDLAPGVLAGAKARGAAVVVSLHDYYFACQRMILRTPDGRLCAGPLGGRACAEACFAEEGEAAAHRWTLRTIYFRRLLELADRIVCPSAYVADFFARLGADRERLRVVRNGIWIDRPADGGAARSSPAERERLSLAYLGALVPHKGLGVLLEALERARLGAADLTVFGAVADLAEAKRHYAAASEIPGLRFRMYGEYEGAELPALLGDADAVIVPSQWPETFCLVAREALACGVPIVVSRLGALADDLVEGVNGFGFEHDDVDGLAAILKRLAREDGLVERLRAGARATEVPRFADHVAALEVVYREALEEARRSAEAASRTAPIGELEREEVRALEHALEKLGFGELDLPAPPPARREEAIPLGAAR